MDQSIEQIESMQSTGMAMGGAVYTIMFILIAALIFFPNLLLYQFATRLQASLSGAGDAATLTAGLNAHRRYYKFTGILLIVAAVITPVAGALLPHALERMAAIPMGLGIIWLGLSLWMDQRKTTAN